MQLIDTHNHLDFPAFDADRDAVLSAARQAGVQRQVLIGVQQAHWSRLRQLCRQQADLHYALGLHPCFLAQHQDAAHLQALREALQDTHGAPYPCAIGEAGLDYYAATADKTRQRALFVAQVELAVAFELPLLLHVRRAHAEVIALLKQYRPPRGGIVHAFTGSYEEAREYQRLGFCVGLGGAGTWPQARRMQQMLARLPLESVVLETDAPDMAPASHPGQRNSPAFLPQICQALATHMGISAERLAEASTANACRLFGWDAAAG